MILRNWHVFRSADLVLERNMARNCL